MSERPLEIRLRLKGKLLELHYADGKPISLAAEYLRVESPSAEVQGHSPDQAITVTGKQEVAIARLEPIGNYAVRIVFDDGHSSGLYTWSYLRELNRDEPIRWPAYLEKLSKLGHARN
jgi:DUF971 family protein